MSYFEDDDSSQIRELKEKLADVQAQLLNMPFSSNLENVESGQNIIPGANPSARVAPGSSGVVGDNLGDHKMTQGLDADEFIMFGLSGLFWKSTLNTLSIQRSGSAPGYDTLEYDSVKAHDFYVNRSFTVIPRFGITETNLQSNVPIVMNDEKLEKVNTIEFGPLSSSEGTIDSDSEGMNLNIPLNKKLKIKLGGITSVEFDDLINHINITNYDLTMFGGKELRIHDFVASRSLNLLHLFGKQIIDYSDTLKITKDTVTTLLEIDTKLKMSVDIDLQDNDLLSARTLIVKEKFPANTIPTRITDSGVIFARPDGVTGKTLLRVLFQSGGSQLIAAEP